MAAKYWWHVFFNYLNQLSGVLRNLSSLLVNGVAQHLFLDSGLWHCLNISRCACGYTVSKHVPCIYFKYVWDSRIFSSSCTLNYLLIYLVSWARPSSLHFQPGWEHAQNYAELTIAVCPSLDTILSNTLNSLPKPQSLSISVAVSRYGLHKVYSRPLWMPSPWGFPRPSLSSLRIPTDTVTLNG